MSAPRIPLPRSDSRLATMIQDERGIRAGLGEPHHLVQLIVGRAEVEGESLSSHLAHTGDESLAEAEPARHTLNIVPHATHESQLAVRREDCRKFLWPGKIREGHDAQQPRLIVGDLANYPRLLQSLFRRG